MPLYLRNYMLIKKQAGQDIHEFPFGKMYPCVEDRYKESGDASGHYFHQDLLVAQRVFQNHPLKHVDVGSRIDGFVAHVAAFREIEVLDIRDLRLDIPNIRFRSADIMDDHFPFRDYCDSVSCLHALEHFGLGRYGDPVDYSGHLKGLRNISGMLKAGGRLHLSVPIGEQRIEFDAHRVFSLKYLLHLLEETYRLQSFSYVDDVGKLFVDVPLEEKALVNNYSCHYGCGIFELSKL
jgi:SAM-dependent methyltransferase